MQYLSGYFWRQEEAVSLVLKHLVYPGEAAPVLFGCLCQGDGAALFCKELTEWFYRDGMFLCKKASNTPESMKNQLEVQLKAQLDSQLELQATKPDTAVVADTETFPKKIQLMGTVLLCVGEYFVLWSSPGQQVHLLNTRFGKSHVRLLTDGKEEQFLCGKFEKGVGILLSAQGVNLHMRAEELAECLAVKYLVSEERLEKRLREIGTEASRRGGEYVSTMLVMTC